MESETLRTPRPTARIMRLVTYVGYCNEVGESEYAANEVTRLVNTPAMMGAERHQCAHKNVDHVNHADTHVQLPLLPRRSSTATIHARNWCSPIPITAGRPWRLLLRQWSSILGVLGPKSSRSEGFWWDHVGKAEGRHFLARCLPNGWDAVSNGRTWSQRRASCRCWWKQRPRDCQLPRSACQHARPPHTARPSLNDWERQQKSSQRHRAHGLRLLYATACER